MAGAIRRMATYLGLVEDGAYYDEHDERHPDGRVEVSENRSASAPAASADHGAGAQVRDMPRAYERPGYVIPTVLPATYNDARRIGEEFRGGSPVLMDLTSMSDSDAKRIVDFAAGLVFGLRGSISRVAPKIFLLSPDGVDVSDIASEQLHRAAAR
ncbi:MAG: DUF552 domain-containing protein [Actinobacteria bacterium]|nr:MAG: DUF552 domain-containing protein [Actinomycetota bacterium]